MKKRILAVLMSLTIAVAFTACGGSKEGAETATVAADQSISDFSIASTNSAATTESSVAPTTDSATDSAADSTAAKTTPAAADTSTVQADVITPIPAQEITDGSVPTEPVADTAAGDAAATTESPASQTMVVTADINVREEPDFEGDILGGFEEGEEVTVTGSEGEWYIVDYKGETGYIYHKYAKAADASSAGSSGESSSGSSSSKYGRLVDGDGDPVDLRYYDGSYEIYDEDGNEVFIEGVND